MTPAQRSLQGRRVAVIGAGWAGLAAGVHLVDAGAHVSVFEAAQHMGGRARTLDKTGPSGQWLDNGQHILIGAYRESLRLMRRVGVAPEQALLRRPLALRFADGSGLSLPDWPSPWDALVGIARARGWSWGDKAALLRQAGLWRLRGFRCAPETSVAALCAALPQPLMEAFIEPLCVSALNTGAHEASAEVFLRVLQDSLMGPQGSSHLLIPRTDMGACFADPAARWLQAQGAHIHRGQRVASIAPLSSQGWAVDGQGFDALILACTSTEAVRLLQDHAQDHAAHAPVAAWCARAQALAFRPIATVYAHLPGAAAHTALLPCPMLALRPRPGAPAQFVFDRGQLGGPAGLLAFVVSTSEGTRADIQSQVLEQARAVLQLPGLQAVQTVIEKRATFACTPGLARPGAAVLPRLWAAGDYIAGPYPATLEGAVLSAQAAAEGLCQDFMV